MSSKGEPSPAAALRVPEAQPPWQPRDSLSITRLTATVTAPENIPLIVVRVDTSDDGLFGLGCATFSTRFEAVVAALQGHVAPLVIGRHPADIEDITRLVQYSSYWRGGPVLNAALSGLDQALWDIAGKRARMPVYELLGGRSRAAVEVYSHASGKNIDETLNQAERLAETGYRSIRLQVGSPGGGNYGAPGTGAAYTGSPYPNGWDPERYLRSIPALFEAARQRLGNEINLMHDVHSRLTPKQAVVLARNLEPYGLSFLEDVVAPEHYDHLPWIRETSPVPIAVGEQLSSVTDAARHIRNGGVDLIRLRPAAIGGLTPTRKLLALAELCGVRIAFHVPADVSPVGVAACVALSVSSAAFGYQESHEYPSPFEEIFPGLLQPVNGYIWPSDQAGWGIEFNPVVAAKHPPKKFVHEAWAAKVRRPDGGLEAP